jgi:hypothetical protein
MQTVEMWAGGGEGNQRRKLTQENSYATHTSLRAPPRKSGSRERAMRMFHCKNAECSIVKGGVYTSFVSNLPPSPPAPAEY